MNRMLLLIVGLLLTMFYAGNVFAENDEVKMEELATPISVSYTLPSQGTFESIDFKREDLSTGKKKKKTTGISVIAPIYSGNEVSGIVRKEGRKADQGNRTEAVSTTAYFLKSDIVKDTQNNSITLTASKKRTTEYKPMWFEIGSYPIPAFEVDEFVAYLKNPDIGYSVEIKSEFKPDAIEANFKKYVTKPGKGIMWNTKAVKSTHTIDDINCNVVISPYRNGSKTTVRFEVPIVGGESNIVDAAPKIDAVIKRVSSIVND